jgi:hypothetical protein
MKKLPKDLNEQIKSSRELVGCDFTELDEMREVFKESVKEVQLNLNGLNRRLYENKPAYKRSYFYIGRGVTRFKFWEIQLPMFQMNRVLLRIKQLYPSYKIYRDGYAITIYTRGDRVK